MTYCPFNEQEMQLKMEEMQLKMEEMQKTLLKSEEEKNEIRLKLERSNEESKEEEFLSEGKEEETQVIEEPGFYPNQIECAENIIQMFKTMWYVMLLAQMQSGKTGSFLYVALKLIHSGVIGKVLIISGNRETALRRQCEHDKDDAINSYAYDNKIHAKIFNGKVKICFGQDLKTQKGVFEEVDDNTLIIWEESHFAQSKDNVPNQWFRHHKLNKALSGDFSELEKRNIRILSVSATPFSEIINNEDKDLKIEKKAVVYLERPSAYRGVGWYLSQNLVETNNIINRTPDLKRMLSVYVPLKKWLVFRSIGGKHTSTIRILSRELEFNPVEEFDMNSEFDMLERVKVPPTKTTIILLKGKCRMGCVVPKSNIGLVFDCAKDANIDTCLQGLWGRICGTPKPSDDFSNNFIKVFVNNDSIDRAQKYSDSFNDEKVPILDKAMNVPKKKKSKRKIRDGQHSIIPINVKDSTDDWNIKFNNEEELLKWLISLPNSDKIWGENNDIQIKSFKEKFKKENIQKRDLSSNNTGYLQDNVFGRIHKSYKNGTHDFKHFDNEDKVQICCFKDDVPEVYRCLGIEKGDYWITAYTKEQDPKMLNHKSYNLPPTTGSEAFKDNFQCSTEGGTIDETNGGQTFHLPKNTYNDTTIMITELKDAIERSKGKDSSTHKITSQWDSKTKTRNGINLDVSIYNITGKANDSSILKDMFKKIGGEFNVSLKAKNATGRSTQGCKRLSEISWVFL